MPRVIYLACRAVLKQSILRSVKSCNFPIPPLPCWKSVNCQHCWQKATSSRLLCSTVLRGRLDRVLLALPHSLAAVIPISFLTGSCGMGAEHSSGSEEEEEETTVSTHTSLNSHLLQRVGTLASHRSFPTLARFPCQATDRCSTGSLF